MTYFSMIIHVYVYPHGRRESLEFFFQAGHLAFRRRLKRARMDAGVFAPFKAAKGTAVKEKLTF